MTMPALLSRFGLHKARFVTTSGQVIFDGVTLTATGGFNHAVHGNVTPVANHTFHGGTEEPDDETRPPAWWDDATLLARHHDAMESAFPGFSYVPGDGDVPPAWGGVIDTGRGKFNVGIFTRHDQGLPRVVVFNHHLGAPAGKRRRKPPHLFVNDNLCVADEGDWDRETHTVATVVGWAAHWLSAYTEWRISRRWPVEGVHVRAS